MDCEKFKIMKGINKRVIKERFSIENISSIKQLNMPY